MYKKIFSIKKKIKVFAIIVTFFFIFSIAFNSKWIEGTNRDNELNISALTPPIFINDYPGSPNDWDWAKTQPWFGGGSGDLGDPYKIEDIIIDGGGVDDCIIIQDSIAYFTIRNCTLYDGVSAGIVLFNVTNGYIVENNCSNNDWGIYIEDSSHNKVVGNNVNGTAWASGIALYSSNYTNIEENILENNWQGIYLDDSNNNNISGNTAFKNVKNGIDLAHGSNFNALSGNTNYNNTLCGIYLFYSNFNNLIENSVYNNKWDGIQCANCDSNNLTGNTAYNNTYDGIYLYSGYSNNLIGNTGYNNGLNGISLEISGDNYIWENNVSYNLGDGISINDSQNNWLIDNIICFNELNGIHLPDSRDIYIWENNVSYNLGDGFYLEDSNNVQLSYNNIICFNKLNGIFLTRSTEDSLLNNIWDNIIFNNTQDGIRIINDCRNSTIGINRIYQNGLKGINLADSSNDTCRGNLIHDNNEMGIYVGLNSDDNLFYENFFVGNGKHAVDDGMDNDWNSTAIGNYWDNHTGPDSEPDGIVDIQYNITGNGNSIDYLPIAEDGAPKITINFPSDGYIFSSETFVFNLTITDNYLDEMWYTIDGGLHNYTQPYEVDEIDKSAWDAAPEGNVTLTFYASDKAGNIGSAEVIIVKDFEAPKINIISPTSGEVVGSDAPIVTISINDPYLVSWWWYNIDGELYNYTTDQGGWWYYREYNWLGFDPIINQTKWDAMPDGGVTLRFYAIDDLGHIGSAGVNITKDTVAPIITINSPAEGEKFGKNAPSFDLTVTDLHLDTIWYTFEADIYFENFTCTNNGTFNQIKWASLPKGEVIIKFYAKDKGGNIASEIVTVIKKVEDELPFMILIIAIVSTAGGIGAAIITIGILRKRKPTKEVI